MDRGAWWATVQGVTKISDTTERLTTYILCACVHVTVNTPRVPPSHKAVSFKLLMSQLFSASFFFSHLFLLVGG